MKRNHYVISLRRKSAFQGQISQSTHFAAVLAVKNKVNSCSDFLEMKEISLVCLPMSLDSEVELLGSSLAQLSP